MQRLAIELLNAIDFLSKTYAPSYISNHAVVHVWLCNTTHTGNVFAASAFDVAAADDAQAVGEQDYFEQHG